MCDTGQTVAIPGEVCRACKRLFRHGVRFVPFRRENIVREIRVIRLLINADILHEAAQTVADALKIRNSRVVRKVRMQDFMNQVALRHNFRDNGFQTERHTGPKMPVQNVDVQHRDSRALQGANLRFQIAQVQTNQREGKEAGFIPDVFHQSIPSFAAMPPNLRSSSPEHEKRSYQCRKRSGPTVL